MPKILHIGGSDSPHVLGIVEQIKKYTDFDQAIVSYNFVRPDEVLLEKIPVYPYDYRGFFTNPNGRNNNRALVNFLEGVIEEEHPDIIQGHYLSQCALPMSYAMLISKKPGIVSLWSTWDIQHKKTLFENNKQCIDLCSYVMDTLEGFLYECLRVYGAPMEKALNSAPPVRLHFYKDCVPDTSNPRIYIPRNYYQNLIFEALEAVLRFHPNIEVTALSPNSIINWTKKHGIINKINFLSRLLTQEEFAEMINRAQYNYIHGSRYYGTSSTTMQSAYFGAVTITHRSHWAQEWFKDEVNTLECDLTAHSISSRLMYSR